MQQNKNTPSIRFAGITDAWEQRKLGELCFLITKGTTPLDKSNTGNINFVKIENIDSISGEINITHRISQREHDTYLRRSQLKENDILFSIAGTLGRVTSVKSDLLPANTNQALAIVRLKEGNLSYIETYLKGKAVSEFVRKNPTIGAQPNLSLEQVGQLDVSIPSEQEQLHIGAFFRAIDTLITLHQRKYDQLVNIKKSMLEKMFPKNGETVPEVRFAGFTDAWEQRKLGEIAEIVGGGTPSTSNPTYWDGDIDWYAPAEMEGQRYAVGSVRKITEQGLQNSSARVLPANRTVLFTSRAGIGKMAILKRQGATNQGFQSMVLTDDCNPYFIYSMGSVIKEKTEGVASGSTFLEISGKMLGNIEIAVPSKPEQDAIAEYFERLDDLITLHQRKLERLQNIKKACLEKMFV